MIFEDFPSIFRFNQIRMLKKFSRETLNILFNR